MWQMGLLFYIQLFSGPYHYYFVLKWDGCHIKRTFVLKTNPKQPLLKGQTISFQIIRDDGRSDADTNGREMTVERQEIYKNYNCSSYGTKLMISALILMVFIQRYFCVNGNYKLF